MIYLSDGVINGFWMFVVDVKYTLDMQLKIRAPCKLIGQWLRRESNRHYWLSLESVYTLQEKHMKDVLQTFIVKDSWLSAQLTHRPRLSPGLTLRYCNEYVYIISLCSSSSGVLSARICSGSNGVPLMS